MSMWRRFLIQIGHFSHVVMYRHFEYVEFDATWGKKHIDISNVRNESEWYVQSWTATKDVDDACIFTSEAASARAQRMSQFNNSRGQYLAIPVKEALIFSVMSR